MKLATLLYIISAITLHAQNFPAPYCDIDPQGTTVEEITSVASGGILISNTDTSSILVDKTDFSILSVNAGPMTISVTGNTVGDFENDLVLFVDWNQNEILDDDNEVYFMGTLSNSTGSDGITVSTQITPPSEGIVPTRARITKIFQDPDSPAEINPCAISFNPFGQGVFPGFGQALDFTIESIFIGVDQFDLNNITLSPNPASNKLTMNSPLAEFDAMQITDVQGRLIENYNVTSSQQLDIANLPAGVYFLNLQLGNNTVTKKFIKR